MSDCREILTHEHMNHSGTISIIGLLLTHVVRSDLLVVDMHTILLANEHSANVVLTKYSGHSSLAIVSFEVHG